MKRHLSKLLDAPALAIAMLVDFAIVGISLYIVAPGPFEKVGMVMLSLVVVLFSVRGWVIGKRMGKGLWICFALASFFLDLSFALVSTDVQAQFASDPELTRLTAKVDEWEAKANNLQAQYDAAINRATMDQLDAQKKDAEAVAEKYREDRDLRLERFESGGSKEITSQALSTAIYDAASSGNPGRITWLVIFSLVFSGLQLTMVTAATATFAYKKDENLDTILMHVEKTRKSRHVGPDKEVARWVGGTWVYARHPTRSPRGAMVKKSTFMTQVKNFDPDLYDKLLSKAIDLGFISDGIIVEKDQEKVITELSNSI